MSGYRPGDAVLKHGYTLAMVDQMSRAAMARVRRRSALALPHRITDAYDGIVDALYAADSTPSEFDLINADRVADALLRHLAALNSKARKVGADRDDLFIAESFRELTEAIIEERRVRQV